MIALLQQRADVAAARPKAEAAEANAGKRPLAFDTDAALPGMHRASTMLSFVPDYSTSGPVPGLSTTASPPYSSHLYVHGQHSLPSSPNIVPLPPPMHPIPPIASSHTFPPNGAQSSRMYAGDLTAASSGSSSPDSARGDSSAPTSSSGHAFMIGDSASSEDDEVQDEFPSTPSFVTFGRGRGAAAGLPSYWHRASSSPLSVESEVPPGAYVLDPLKNINVFVTSACARRTGTAARVERRRRER